MTTEQKTQDAQFHRISGILWHIQSTDKSSILASLWFGKGFFARWLSQWNSSCFSQNVTTSNCVSKRTSLKLSDQKHLHREQQRKRTEKKKTQTEERGRVIAMKRPTKKEREREREHCKLKCLQQVQHLSLSPSPPFVMEQHSSVGMLLLNMCKSHIQSCPMQEPLPRGPGGRRQGILNTSPAVC